MFFKKGLLPIHSKCTGKHFCGSVISITLYNNFIKITLLHGWSFVNLPDIFKAPFYRNNSGRLLLIWALQVTKYLPLGHKSKKKQK